MGVRIALVTDEEGRRREEERSYQVGHGRAKIGSTLQKDGVRFPK